ncbi:phosphate ABC transporter permease PstA [Galactobacter caseinivorans]|uniref:Phosphate transport system permease protein PstA n=1 Tax=Galactobacter caseinivorans TaxID=2676123 RepID=A0A496PGK0_9MICC|nr:phosphate ABC transporter permease PstA [Galactobacter caseinivorans]RKW69614.1 phosphate ABC transporter permease PtsA [Galactobacter caseinivorans]
MIKEQTPSDPTKTAAGELSADVTDVKNAQQGPGRRHGRSRLTAGQKPRWTAWAVAGGALIIAAALMALIGFNIAGWLIITAILYVVAMYVTTTIMENRRKATDGLWTNLIVGSFLIALIPLISVLWTVISHGTPGLTAPGFFASDMKGVTGITDQKTEAGDLPLIGGIKHALMGTLLITLAATIISVPIGLLTSIYLVEYSNDNSLSKVIRFFVDVMTGIPSIVAGLFASGLMMFICQKILQMPPGSNVMGFSAAVGLSVLMIPVVVRSTEEMLRVVPNELREASAALGVRKWRTTLKVVLPTAISGIASGITLAIARVVGETAPILVTAGVALSTNFNLFKDWMMTLPVFIYRQLMNPTAPMAPTASEERAWGAALVLIIIVMLLNLLARVVAKIFAPKTAGR